MTEEKKAINNLWSSATDVMFNVLYSQEEMQEDIKVALNLIQKQQKENIKLKQENEKKDKIIDEIIEIISHYDALDFSDICEKRIVECDKCENERNNCIKQYFENKVESEDKQC